jgi:hypothetical protein
MSVSDTLADSTSTSLGLSRGLTILILVAAIVVAPVIFWLFVWWEWKMIKDHAWRDLCVRPAEEWWKWWRR